LDGCVIPEMPRPTAKRTPQAYATTRRFMARRREEGALRARLG